ncbi:MAG TPA: class II aldolase/adducin family protein [Deltaproteobacteria bacterium]|jgi:ribulose-5-phosphate 4-epimerase/fuculose-1-phosphate aldolase|nr:class II aldolase/adducin family protein [Deltaproteobacteria bacterium]
MQKQIDKYLAKLEKQGLIEGEHGASLFGLDDEIYTNAGTVPDEIRTLFSLLNINSLIVARPEPLLWSIITRLASEDEIIRPCDCESLTFFHDVPVVHSLQAGPVARALNRRKGCIVKDTGIVTFGTVNLEQAFITMSSICFASFVKFFSDALNGLHGCGCTPKPDPLRIDAVLELIGQAAPMPSRSIPAVHELKDEAQIIRAMDEAGKALVGSRLVDSFFGNISYRQGDIIYISQTGSSLDELPGCIDRVPLDGSSTCEITSSSELLAHVKTYELTADNAILHGHPRFSVIMSMFGGELPFGEKRFVEDIPVVSGEVGAGRHGLSHTLPPAVKEHGGAIVSGHGTFTSGAVSFSDAFDRLSEIEHRCYLAYRELLRKGGAG